MGSWGPGPVFAYECVVAARRWQTYAVRTGFLAILFLSLAYVWVHKTPGMLEPMNRNVLATIGEAFFIALASTQLVLVLLAAPAYLAGSICLDKARGSLAHVLVTDLTAAEIVLGKFAARVLPLLGLLLTSVPVLALATLLGGIEPEAVVISFAITLASAFVVSALTLFLSVWGEKPHEVLLATYLAVGVWLLAVPIWWWLKFLFWGLGTPPDWLERTNPFLLVFAPYEGPGGPTLGDHAAFVAGCLGLGAVLLLFASLSLRRAARGKPVRPARRWRVLRPLRWLRLPRLPIGPSLDANPVLWREWRKRQPSTWLRIIWGVYAAIALLASLGALLTDSGGGHREMAAFVNAFQFSIGLLLVAVSSVAGLFEERVNGSLEILLVTPLSTASIVWGKWWAGYRLVAWVTLLPALLGYLVAIQGYDVTTQGMRGSLLFLLMLAYGALVNSLGLALATWVRRFGVAFGMTVAIYVLIAVGPILPLMAGSYSDTWRGFASLSPWYGVGESTASLSHAPLDSHLGWKLFWLVGYTAAAGVLALATGATFDSSLGRVREGVLPVPRRPFFRRPQAPQGEGNSPVDVA